MPAPLWQDALEDLRRTGAPITNFNLNEAMNFLAANPQYRPSYMQGGGLGNEAMLAGNMGASPSDYLPQVTATELPPPTAQVAPQPVARTSNPSRKAPPVGNNSGKRIPVPVSKDPFAATQANISAVFDKMQGTLEGVRQANGDLAQEAQQWNNMQPAQAGEGATEDSSWNIGKVVAGILAGLGVAGGAAALSRGKARIGMRGRNPDGPPSSGAGAGPSIPDSPTLPGPGVTRMQTPAVDDTTYGMRIPNRNKAIAPPVQALPNYGPIAQGDLSSLPVLPNAAMPNAGVPVGRPVTITPEIIQGANPMSRPALPAPKPKPRQKPDPRASRVKSTRNKRTTY